MSHKSHPQKCEHNLKFCSQCDIVFCDKCGEEWRKETLNWNFTAPSSGTGIIPWQYQCSHTLQVKDINIE